MNQCSRRDELEADRHGLLIILRAGYALEDAEEALRRVAMAVGDAAPGSTHPTLAVRLAVATRERAALDASARRFDEGALLLELGLYDPAIEALQEFLHLFPCSPAGWHDLGVCHLRRAGAGPKGGPWLDRLAMDTIQDRHLGRSALFDLASGRRSLKAALALQEDRVGTLSTLAALERRAGRLDRAEELVTRALQAVPDNPSVHVNQGNIEASRGDWTAALTAYQAAEKLDPGAIDIRANRALVLGRRGDRRGIKQAVRTWKALLDQPGFSALASAELERLEVDFEAPASAAAEESAPWSLGPLHPGLPQPDAEEADPSLVARQLAVPWDEPLTYLHSRSGGLQLISGEQSGLLVAAMTPGCPLNTPEGLGIGSSRRRLEDTLGPPDLEARVGGRGADRLLLVWSDHGVAAHLDSGSTVRLLLWSPGWPDPYLPEG